MISRIVPPDSGSRAQRYTLTAADGKVDFTALTRGEDFRIDLTLDGNSYAMGRSDDALWRRTPTGTVRIIRSDVQGDDLDRWPRAVFGFYTKGCTAAGDSASAASDDWVLYCRAAGDFAHFYYIDPASGRIIREVAREGVREMTYVFRFDKDALSGWHVSGAGGDADVQLFSSTPCDVGAADVAIPQSVTDQFAISQKTVAIDASFPVQPWGYIKVPVDVNGHKLTFVLDTGTTQILMDVGAAERAGLHERFGHAVAQDVRIGGAFAKNLSVETVNLFGGQYEDGLLGNEFFTGHIVHLDYGHHRLELLPHAGFNPPADAHQMFMYADEGMPLVHARVSGVEGDRFALDSAGYTTLLTANFVRRSGIKLTSEGELAPARYLEGNVRMEQAIVDSFVLPPFDFGAADVLAEVPDGNNLDIPLDGIIGSYAMSNFEWWFDYDNNQLWVRR